MDQIQNAAENYLVFTKQGVFVGMVKYPVGSSVEELTHKFESLKGIESWRKIADARQVIHGQLD